MALLPTNQRDQAMLLTGIAGIACAMLYWNFVFEPRGVALDEMRDRIARMESTNERAKGVLSRGTVKDVQVDADVLQDNLAVVRTLIPAGNEVPALLDQIVGAARRAGLEVQSFVPGATTEGMEFDTHRYRMTMTGPYHRIGELLAAIGSLPRIVTPVNLSLAPAAGPARRPAGREQLLDASFDVQTYVVRTGPPAARAAPSNRPVDAIADLPRDSAGNVVFVREVFSYSRGGRRDPFVSLVASGDLRPLLSDLEVVAIIYDPTGRGSVATLKDVVTNELYRVRVGSVFGRMRVTAIRQRDLSVAIDDFGFTRQETLSIPVPSRR
jgi:type IV pilus assembly protein PilO